MLNHFVLLIILLLAPFVCNAAQEIIILKGTPVIQTDSSLDASNTIQLTPSQQVESRLIVSQLGQKYYWASRQDRELTKHESGIYTTYLETKGAGYVKVMKSSDKAIYMEHMSLGIETITYWGVID